LLTTYYIKNKNIHENLNTHFPNKESKHMRNIYNYVYYTKHVTILYKRNNKFLSLNNHIYDETIIQRKINIQHQ